MNKVLVFIGVLLSFLGCSSPSTPSVQKEENVRNVEVIAVDARPNWIKNPNEENKVCAVGSSKKSADIKLMNKIAFLKAKANISKEIEIYIETELDSKYQSSGVSKISTSARQQSTNMLRNVKVVDTYEDSKHGIYYLKACMQKNPINKGDRQ